MRQSTELTEQEKDYIKSQRVWFKGQKLNLEENKNELAFCLKRIDLEQRQSDVYNERIDNNINYTESSVKVYEDWCKENNIDPDIIL